MIITRTPFRVSFLGGGTDLPWFYEQFGGTVLSTSINQYMYISGHPLFETKGVLLKYSKIEFVDSAAELQHPIAREVLEKYKIAGFDVSVTADVPAGTGLGSSSAFTVGLLKLTSEIANEPLSKSDLADLACQIEIKKLKEPIGKQDQYASAFGGLNQFIFNQDGSVTVKPIFLSGSQFTWLNHAMILVPAGLATRSASRILANIERDAKISKSKLSAFQELKSITEAAIEQISLEPEKLGWFLNESWKLKKMTSPEISSKAIDDLVEFGLKNGAIGAKLLGAGAGGFVLFIVPPEKRDAFEKKFRGVNTIKVRIDNEGSKIIYNE